MNIEVKDGWYGTTILINDTNVKLEYDAKEDLYELNDNGKPNYLKRIGEDISDDSMNMFSNTLEILADKRTRDYDASELIESLFILLTTSQKCNLLKTLNDDYLQ